MHRSPLTRQARITATSQDHTNRVPADRPALDLVYADGNSFDQPIVSVCDGLVTYVNHNFFGGKGNRSNGEKLIQIRGNDGHIYQYNHLNRITVNLNQRVKAGDKIGTMGYSGFTIPSGKAGTHLHIEVWRNGLMSQATDPLQFININNFNNMSNQATKEQKAFTKLWNHQSYKQLSNELRQAVNPNNSELNLIHWSARLVGLSGEINKKNTVIKNQRDIITNQDNTIKNLEDKVEELEKEIKYYQDLTRSLVGNTDEGLTITESYDTVATPKAPKNGNIEAVLGGETPKYETPIKTIRINDTITQILEGLTTGGGVITIASLLIPLLIPEIEASEVATMAGVLTTLIASFGVGTVNAEKIKRKRKENDQS
jgi:hypothetical protein